MLHRQLQGTNLVLSFCSLQSDIVILKWFCNSSLSQMCVIQDGVKLLMDWWSQDLCCLIFHSFCPSSHFYVSCGNVRRNIVKSMYLWKNVTFFSPSCIKNGVSQVMELYCIYRRVVDCVLQTRLWCYNVLVNINSLIGSSVVLVNYNYN